MSPLIGLPIVLACLCVQSFFSGAEIAMVGANRHTLEKRAETGDRGARLAIRLLTEEDQLLGTCLIGTNLSVISSTTIISAVAFYSELGLFSPFMPLLFIPVALIFGEALPKTIYLANADFLAPIIAFPLRAAQGLFFPLLSVVRPWSDLLRHLLGDAEAAEATREELIMLLDNPELDPDEQKFIRGVFEAADTPVEQVMTPLVHVDAIPITATIKDAIDSAILKGHSRVPVYESRVDNLIGIIHHHDLLFAADECQSVSQIMRPIHYYPEAKHVGDLLNQMRESGEHFGVIVDEYGGTVGIITIEDLLEEIVGEIQDERDDAPDRVIQLDESTWRVPGQLEIEELEQIIKRSLPEGDFETISGLILDHTGRIPSSGETFYISPLVLTVEASTARMIQWVHVSCSQHISH